MRGPDSYYYNSSTSQSAEERSCSCLQEETPHSFTHSLPALTAPCLSFFTLSSLPFSLSLLTRSAVQIHIYLYIDIDIYVCTRRWIQRRQRRYMEQIDIHLFLFFFLRFLLPVNGSDVQSKEIEETPLACKPSRHLRTSRAYRNIYTETHIDVYVYMSKGR